MAQQLTSASAWKKCPQTTCGSSPCSRTSLAQQLTSASAWKKCSQTPCGSLLITIWGYKHLQLEVNTRAPWTCTVPCREYFTKFYTVAATVELWTATNYCVDSHCFIMLVEWLTCTVVLYIVEEHTPPVSSFIYKQLEYLYHTTSSSTDTRYHNVARPTNFGRVCLFV